MVYYHNLISFQDFFPNQYFQIVFSKIFLGLFANHHKFFCNFPNLPPAQKNNNYFVLAFLKLCILINCSAALFIVVDAASGIGVPGPKIAATPVSYKN